MNQIILQNPGAGRWGASNPAKGKREMMRKEIKIHEYSSSFPVLWKPNLYRVH